MWDGESSIDNHRMQLDHGMRRRCNTENAILGIQVAMEETYNVLKLRGVRFILRNIHTARTSCSMFAPRRPRSFSSRERRYVANKMATKITAARLLHEPSSRAEDHSPSACFLNESNIAETVVKIFWMVGKEETSKSARTSARPPVVDATVKRWWTLGHGHLSRKG
ncbi:hypothetical protein DVH05_008041 [Phytophthora capsici]|nr:hypothetical protein DVH05_008041 [Phytophthora capsici]